MVFSCKVIEIGKVVGKRCFVGHWPLEYQLDRGNGF